MWFSSGLTTKGVASKKRHPNASLSINCATINRPPTADKNPLRAIPVSIQDCSVEKVHILEQTDAQWISVGKKKSASFLG